MLRSDICVGLVLALAASLAPSSALCEPGRIVGRIDGIVQDADHFFLSGWACQERQQQSIAVQLFVEKTPGNAASMAPLLAETANLHSEPAVNHACQDQQGAKHRFLLALPYGYGPGSNLVVHGLRIVDGVPNDALAGSGSKLPLLTALKLPYPALPRLAGTYRKLEHPGVFTSAEELKNFAARINRPGSYSARRFGLLAGQIKNDLASGIDWNVTYSGADGGIYQYAFSYEPRDNHEAAIAAALKLPPGTKQPAGAAIVAARASLYAALLKAGATLPPSAPSADQAVQLAKRILLAWADHGFRAADGKFLKLDSFTRDGHGRPDGGLGLPLGRGVVYSVHAQDLLQSLGALSVDEIRRANAFHGEIFELMRQSHNVLYAGIGFPYSDCSRYTNISTNAVAGQLAIARLLDDERKFNAMVEGSDASPLVLESWTQLFDRVIYGKGSGPSPACVENADPDSLTSLAHHHDYQTLAASPGEIADRFRSTNAAQGVGYPMFTLERLLDIAEILRIAGFDAYGYRGAHGQGIEMAMQYYACFAQGAGFAKVITAENAGKCADAAQYYGKLVNGVERMMLFGADRFPNNAAITALEAAAQTAATSGPFANDAILFGKWRD